MSTPAEIVAQVMVDRLLGTEAGAWPIYISFFQDDPHEAIVVFDTPARPDGRLMRTGEKIEHAGIQIQVRGLDYRATFQKARTIAFALDRVKKVSVVVSSEEPYTLHNVSRSGGVIPLGVDDKKDRRHYFVINATITMNRPLTSDSPISVDDYSVTVDDPFYP